MVIFIAFLAAIIALLIYWSDRHLSYFKKRNVPYLKSFPFIGALTDSLTGKCGIYECTEKIYKTEKLKNESFFGIFMFHKPSLLLKDPEMIKELLVKNYNSFSNRAGGSDVHDPIGNENLFTAKNPLWKNIQKKLSPVFTSRKMKLMFSTIDKISDQLVEHLEEKSLNKSSVDVEVREAMVLYTTDSITNCAYGIDANSFKNPNEGFVNFGNQIFGYSVRRGFEFTSIFVLPEITKFFNFYMFTKEGTDFIRKSITDIMKEREKSKTTRNDLIDALIEIKNSDTRNNDGQPLKLDTLIAQAAVFFSGGHETSAGTITFALYELSKQQDIQNRLREEIYETLLKTNGKLTYEAVMNESSYLHQVVCETLRLYPVIPLLDRECTNPNGFSLKPFADFVIPHKMPIYIPIYAIHRDEKYFPEPSKFDPDRFSPENINSFPTFSFLPFGVGIRLCIGERFGLMQTKTALIKLLMNYRMEMTSETPQEMKLAKNAMVIQSESPIVLKFVKDRFKF